MNWSIVQIETAEYSASLPWSTRLKIAIGAARGLAFLHEAAKPVIYRDFKTSNILLNSVYISIYMSLFIHWFLSNILLIFQNSTYIYCFYLSYFIHKNKFIMQKYQ